jgi:hypothetical protein
MGMERLISRTEMCMRVCTSTIYNMMSTHATPSVGVEIQSVVSSSTANTSEIKF